MEKIYIKGVLKMRMIAKAMRITWTILAISAMIDVAIWILTRVIRISHKAITRISKSNV